MPGVLKLVPSGSSTGPSTKRCAPFHETLRTLDDEERTFSYSIDDGPDAVSKDNVQGYIGEVRVFPVTDDNSTFVLWASGWDSSGGGVQEFCDPIHQALLSGLKSHFA
jgi:hypothetical protein